MGTERRKLNEEIKKAFLRGYIRHEYKKKKSREETGVQKEVITWAEINLQLRK